jgi:gas vesicle protein GvpL/GvpF
MTTHAERGQDAALPEGAAGDHGVYVYGVLASSTEVPEALESVGDDDTPVRLVTHGDIAAVVSDVYLTRALGTPQDLLAHERVLDAIAADTTVLPMRFGGVVTSEEAVTDELLAPHHDHFKEVLAELDGMVQFSVRGRYVDNAHLREILEEDREVRQLRDALQEVPEDAGYEERLRLGELVSEAVVRKRAADAEELIAALSSSTVATAQHEVAGEDDAFDVAFLVEHGMRDQFEHALDDLGDEWSGRISLRLTGPLAPYDFVPKE